MNTIDLHACRVQSGKAVDLSAYATTPPDALLKEEEKALWPERLRDSAQQLNRLQTILHAGQCRGLLLVLQGMDTAGKDGCIRSVFSHVSPLGVRAEAFGVPHDLERRHDFLWRIHTKTPAQGEMVIFNRSHYEDVLVPVVRNEISADACAKRLAHIRHFECLLDDAGIVVLKCYLHLSKPEQKKRLQARMDDPLKHWKVQASDFVDRENWHPFMRAYAQALQATSTDRAPWYVVPADSKAYRDLFVSALLVHTLQAMQLVMPQPKLKLSDYPLN